MMSHSHVKIHSKLMDNNQKIKKFVQFLLPNMTTEKKKCFFYITTNVKLYYYV